MGEKFEKPDECLKCTCEGAGDGECKPVKCYPNCSKVGTHLIRISRKTFVVLFIYLYWHKETKEGVKFNFPLELDED